MVLVILQARLTTPCLVSICMRSGLEANYVSHHHQTLDRLRTLLTYSNFVLHLQGMQNDCDMIPLMMQSNFKPKGWRKSHLKALPCLLNCIAMPLTVDR